MLLNFLDTAAQLILLLTYKESVRSEGLSANLSSRTRSSSVSDFLVSQLLAKELANLRKGQRSSRQATDRLIHSCLVLVVALSLGTFIPNCRYMNVRWIAKSCKMEPPLNLLLFLGGRGGVDCLGIKLKEWTQTALGVPFSPSCPFFISQLSSLIIYTMRSIRKWILCQNLFGMKQHPVCSKFVHFPPCQMRGFHDSFHLSRFFLHCIRHLQAHV